MTPPLEFARWAILLLFGLVLALAGASDVKDRRIPNWTILAVIALFAAWWLAEPAVSLGSALGAALIMFVTSCALYFFGIVGAGDSKLVTVVALFVGLSRLPQFILYMSLAGGALALCLLAMEPTRALVMLQMRGKGRMDRGVPYGVAIALGGLFAIFAPVPHFAL
jgi:prepilin peptidase CpaA